MLGEAVKAVDLFVRCRQPDEAGTVFGQAFHKRISQTVRILGIFGEYLHVLPIVADQAFGRRQPHKTQVVLKDFGDFPLVDADLRVGHPG